MLSISPKPAAGIPSNAGSSVNEGDTATCVSRVWPLRTEADYRKAQSIVEKLAVQSRYACIH
ncbi:hypothetical protein DSTSK_14040 [Desulforhabdus sp. TSK]|nr:hypothetical protein DSTSK_14040 [Desulforhabdus sp. TSK]